MNVRHPQGLPQSLPELYLYAHGACSFYQDKDVHKIEDVLNKEFLTLWEWFVDSKLSIHFGKDKTKCIIFFKLVPYCVIFKMSP